jgi:hypothetical protein
MRPIIIQENKVASLEVDVKTATDGLSESIGSIKQIAQEEFERLFARNNDIFTTSSPFHTNQLLLGYTTYMEPGRGLASITNVDNWFTRTHLINSTI